MISCELGVRVDEPPQLVGDRRQPAAAVDEDRHAALGREREDRRQPLVVQLEALRARVELDPAGAEVEAASRLLERLLGQVEPDERDEAPVRPLRERERAVVRGAEGRVAVGLIQAEHVRAGHAVALHPGHQLVEAARHPVDVVAEVDVRVVDVGAVGKLAAKLALVEREQLLGPLECVLHGAESMWALAPGGDCDRQLQPHDRAARARGLVARAPCDHDQRDGLDRGLQLRAALELERDEPVGAPS